jgi:hypothetical protein
MFFNHILGTYTGNSISIFTGVTINTGDIIGTTIVTLDENFDNLNREDAFGNVIVFPSDSTWQITKTYPLTLTPTPTNTPTPTPTPTPIPTTQLRFWLI